MENKKPLFAGLLNMVVPGLGYLYTQNNMRRFIKTLIGGITAIVVLFFIGNAMQNSTSISLPQGTCPGALVLVVLVPLFLSGQKMADQHNKRIKNATRYDSKQHGSVESQLTKNQEMRDKHIISKEEYESRKDDISSKE